MEHTMPWFREVHGSSKSIVTRSNRYSKHIMTSLHRAHHVMVPRSLWFLELYGPVKSMVPRSAWFREAHSSVKSIVIHSPSLHKAHRYAKQSLCKAYRD